MTLITHGFNSDGSDWVNAMADAVAKYPNLALTNSTRYEIFFEQNSQGEYVPTQRKLAGVDPKSADSGEIIVILDWSQLAGDLGGVDYSTTNVAPSVVSTLTSPTFIPELAGKPLIELPLHLIGHSRGGSLMCEIARMLGQQGIWVDHLTTLDPHPLNNDYDDTILTDVVDGPAIPYVNVLFADNYYQINNSFLGLDPSGQFEPGAYNRYLDVRSGGYGGIAPYHSNTHLWYHGTIDWNTPASDSAAMITALERSSWWTAPETNGTSAGFLYSLIGAGNRFSDATPAGGTNRIRNGFNQIWDFGAGSSSNRFALPDNSGLWPNLLTLNIASTNLNPFEKNRQGYTITAGESLPLKLTFQYGQLQNTNLTLKIFLDPDFNPYSTNETPLQTFPLQATGVGNVTTLNTAISGSQSAAPGIYAIGAAIADGIRVRYLYAPELLHLLPSVQPPEIGQPQINSGFIQADVHGAIGQTIVVDTSLNLIDWTPIATNQFSSSVWIFRDAFEPDAKLKAYRARLLQ